MNKLLSILLLFLTPFAYAQSDRLEKSPRHQEWVVVKHGNRSVHCFVVYPQKKEKATTVIVIHENKGLTDWVRTVADQLAEAGYLAIAPDLLSGTGPNGGKTSDFPSADAATEGIYKLPPDQVTARPERCLRLCTQTSSFEWQVDCRRFLLGRRTVLSVRYKPVRLKSIICFLWKFSICEG